MNILRYGLYQQGGTGGIFPTDGLMFYAPFNEGSGNIVNDIIGGYTMYFSNPNWGVGIKGGCADFNNANTSIVTMDSDGTPIDDDVNHSFSFWLYLNSFSSASAQQFLINNPILNSNNFEYAIYVHNPNKSLYHRYHTYSTPIKELDTDFIGKWHNIIRTRDGSNLKWYLDGVEIYSVNQPIAMKSDSRLGFGRYTWGTYGIVNGRLCDLGFWNKTLTPEEVQIIWNGGVGNFPY